MKKFLVLTVVFGVAVILAVSVAVWLVTRAELVAEQERLAFCEMLAIGQALNEDFEFERSYPESLADSSRVDELVGSNPCRGELRTSDDGYLDPWGKDYMYDRISDGHSLIASSRDIRIHLIEGMIKLDENHNLSEAESDR